MKPLPKMIIKESNLRKVCMNADEILRVLKEQFPNEVSTSKVARICGCSGSSVSRWKKNGMADLELFCKAYDYYKNLYKEEPNVRLNKASIEQIKARIKEIGYSKFFDW